MQVRRVQILRNVTERATLVATEVSEKYRTRVVLALPRHLPSGSRFQTISTSQSHCIGTPYVAVLSPLRSRRLALLAPRILRTMTACHFQLVGKMGHVDMSTRTTHGCCQQATGEQPRVTVLRRRPTRCPSWARAPTHTASVTRQAAYLMEGARKSSPWPRSGNSIPNQESVIISDPREHCCPRYRRQRTKVPVSCVSVCCVELEPPPIDSYGVTSPDHPSISPRFGQAYGGVLRGPHLPTPIVRRLPAMEMKPLPTGRAEYLHPAQRSP